MTITDARDLDTGWELKIGEKWYPLQSVCTSYWVTINNRRVAVDKTQLIRAQVEYCDRLKHQRKGELCQSKG